MISGDGGQQSPGEEASEGLSPAVLNQPRLLEQGHLRAVWRQPKLTVRQRPRSWKSPIQQG